MIKFTLPLPEPVTLPAGETAAVQLYEVLPTLLFKNIRAELPEQMDCADGEAETTGKGFTVTTAFTALPVQPFALAFTLYVAVPETNPVVVKACEIVDPEPAEAPDTPDWPAVQV
jgi:hypothetical protein